MVARRIKRILSPAVASLEGRFPMLSGMYDPLLAGVTGLLELRNRLRSDFALAMAIKSHVPKTVALNLPDFRQKVWPLMTERERRLVGVQTRSYDTWGGGRFGRRISSGG